MNGDKKKDEMISPLTGMEYVDSNEDYDNKNENQNQKKNSALMIAPGKTATALYDSNEGTGKTEKKTKSAAALSDSNEKTEGTGNTEKKKIVAKREDFEKVFHKTESEMKAGDGKRESDFVETFHETETKEKENVNIDDKKSVENGPEKKSDTFDEVFHTTPGIRSKCFCCLGNEISNLSIKNQIQIVLLNLYFFFELCFTQHKDFVQTNFLLIKFLINISLASSTSFCTTPALCLLG